MFGCRVFVFFNDTATTEIYTLSLHDALPIWGQAGGGELVAVHGDGVADLGRVAVEACHLRRRLEHARRGGRGAGCGGDRQRPVRRVDRHLRLYLGGRVGDDQRRGITVEVDLGRRAQPRPVDRHRHQPRRRRRREAGDLGVDGEGAGAGGAAWVGGGDRAGEAGGGDGDVQVVAVDDGEGGADAAERGFGGG